MLDLNFCFSEEDKQEQDALMSGTLYSNGRGYFTFMPHALQRKHCVHMEHKDNGESSSSGDALISAQSDSETLEATPKVFGGSERRGAYIPCN